MVTANMDAEIIAQESTQDMLRAVNKLLVAPGRDARKSIKAIDFNSTWLPFLTAAKAAGGLPQLSNEALGSAILPKIREGKLKRSKNGRILTEVREEVANTCKLVFASMVYQNLVSPVDSFRAANPEAFAAQAAKQERAGQPAIRAAQEMVLMDQLETESGK